MEEHNSLVKRLTEIIKQVKDENTKEEPSTNYRDVASLFPSLGGSARRSEPARNHPYRHRANSRTSTTTNRSKQSKPVCKDIILLPNPLMSSVPRYKVREELYARELVASAVIINGEQNEAEIRATFEAMFASKLIHIKGKKFEFVRAVGSKIVDPKVNRASTHEWVITCSISLIILKDWNVLKSCLGRTHFFNSHRNIGDPAKKVVCIRRKQWDSCFCSM